MNKQLFKIRALQANETLEDVAKFLRIAPQTLSNKVNGKSSFTQDEIAKLKTHWDLTAQDIDSIFFAD